MREEKLWKTFRCLLAKTSTQAPLVNLASQDLGSGQGLGEHLGFLYREGVLS